MAEAKLEIEIENKHEEKHVLVTGNESSERVFNNNNLMKKIIEFLPEKEKHSIPDERRKNFSNDRNNPECVYAKHNLAATCQFFNNHYGQKRHEVIKNLLINGASGQSYTVCRLLRYCPEFSAIQAELKDVWTGRIFPKISLFQYLVWVRDTHLCNEILDCIPKNQQGKNLHEKLLKQMDELQNNALVYTLDEEKEEKPLESHFSLKPWHDALGAYIKKKKQYVAYDKKTKEGCSKDFEGNMKKHWCQIVGWEQLYLPANVRQQYSDPIGGYIRDDREISIFARENFSRKLTFRYDSITTKRWDANAMMLGLGTDFAIVRDTYYGWDIRAARSEECSIKEAEFNYAWISELDAVRVKDLQALRQRLEKSPQKLEKNASGGCILS